MRKIDEGGYAFPRAATETNNPNMFFEPQEGMTLRDYFAAAALQGILANPIDVRPETVVKASYEYADAMLAARKEGANE